MASPGFEVGGEMGMKVGRTVDLFGRLSTDREQVHQGPGSIKPEAKECACCSGGPGWCKKSRAYLQELKA